MTIYSASEKLTEKNIAHKLENRFLIVSCYAEDVHAANFGDASDHGRFVMGVAKEHELIHDHGSPNRIFFREK